MILDSVNSRKLNSLQNIAIDGLELIYTDYGFKSFEFREHNNIGVRGHYLDKLNFTLELLFINSKYKLQFLLSYDQLEYYLINNCDRIIKECVIEDFYEEEEMIKIFFNFLNEDLQKM